jgi:hypothetical protein
MSEAEKAAEHNFEHFMEHGPGLSYGYVIYVIARRPSTGEILLGGLGGMGTGQMWEAETAEHQRYPGYTEAQIVHPE